MAKRRSEQIRVGLEFKDWLVCDYMPVLQKELRRIPTIPEATDELARAIKNDGVFKKRRNIDII